ncbi:MAG: phosphate ABC transporter substrate-binding protein [Syntrophobacteraceae bacterium]|nr:phosphate ABC transporter substrate-binding protein [Desulfobacteraceae bacterium]
MKKHAWLVVTVFVLCAFTGSGWAFADTIKVDGSTTVLPIAQKVTEAYMKESPSVNITVSGGGSGNGIKALIDGTTDVATSSRFLKPEEIKLAMEKGVYPVPFAVAYDCIVPVVHPGNPVSDLSISQLKAIYMGEIKNWKDVGGPNLQIVVISRDTSSGTYEVWEEKVMKMDRVYAGALLQASNGAVLQAVSKNKFAIGYLGIGYVDKSVKPLTVNGIQGNAETALSGSYPVSRALFMFTRGWPEGNTLSFVNFMLNPGKGQKYVREAGFVPLYSGYGESETKNSAP